MSAECEMRLKTAQDRVIALECENAELKKDLKYTKADLSKQNAEVIRLRDKVDIYDSVIDKLAEKLKE